MNVEVVQELAVAGRHAVGDVEGVAVAVASEEGLHCGHNRLDGHNVPAVVVEREDAAREWRGQLAVAQIPEGGRDAQEYARESELAVAQ